MAGQDGRHITPMTPVHAQALPHTWKRGNHGFVTNGVARDLRRSQTVEASLGRDRLAHVT